MDERRLKVLFEKFTNKTITDEEREIFLSMLTDPEAIPLLRSYEMVPIEAITMLPDDASKRILTTLFPKNEDVVSKRPDRPFLRFRIFRLSAAALALLCMLAIGYRLFFPKEKTIRTIAYSNKVIRDAMPGHNGAVLILPNGQSFFLDTIRSGKVARGFLKSEDKTLNIFATSDVPYATLVTPLGRQQKLQLSDGTIAWLNAGSSIKFPTMFKGGQRSVEITGEVYFEVVHDAAHPFVVKAGGEEIHDLGTQFDVNAYDDEPAVKTTLLEGRVQIGKCVLKPGEQYTNGHIQKVDADAAVAWISGYFQFEHADIRAVMKQLARWYNVEVHYEGNVPTQVFEGEIQRSLKLSQVLDLLTGTGIHYILDGNKLIIQS